MAFELEVEPRGVYFLAHVLSHIIHNTVVEMRMETLDGC